MFPPFELELLKGACVWSRWMFLCVFVSQSLFMSLVTTTPPLPFPFFSPPPGKLAQKTGAQKAAKRSRQPLSTPNACAAGYPPTPC